MVTCMTYEDLHHKYTVYIIWLIITMQCLLRSVKLNFNLGDNTQQQLNFTASDDDALILKHVLTEINNLHQNLN